MLLRRQKGMTQTQVAKKLKCCPYWVRKMEKMEVDPSRLVEFWNPLDEGP